MALQRHLDRQSVGFPATKSGSELKILKFIFTPEEARIAACLTYKPDSIGKIFDKARHLVESPQHLAEMLDRMGKKGGIDIKEVNGERCYCNAPFVVGMYEYQVNNLTPEFLAAFNEYTSNLKFGLEVISTKLPQLRTIPISKSIQPQHNVSTFDQITELLQIAQAPFVVLDCICRKKKGMENDPCKVTDRNETCLVIGPLARMAQRNGIGREVTRDETIVILEKNQKDGLVLQPSNTKQAEFICSCCGCCCGMLSIQKMLPKPVDFWASNFYAQIDAPLCSGCGVCEKRCQVGAVKFSSNKNLFLIDLNRCIGCGLCVPTCPQKAISLQKKPLETDPPQTWGDLHEINMIYKKGNIGKIGVLGKVIVDAIRTGQTNLLRPPHTF